MAETLLLKPQEAADQLRVSRAKTYELISSGQIPSIRVGSSVRVPAGALREWISQQLADRNVA
ncbi:MAG TPA: helix-turn-helix domain-containing protein [Gemmatimonadaceae bacterium]|nr:helix-turn-helix domain-containing protein [Gemmatimonadaceae bacterium]